MNSQPHCINNFVKQYIRGQWVNYRRSLIEPQAREELLAGSLLYFYCEGTTVDKPVYQSKERKMMWCNPLCADSSGEFPSFYPQVGEEGRYKVELHDRNDQILFIADSGGFFK